MVDLIKIDVERAELDVLRGIKWEDWPKIRQLVMEFHDVGGRREEILRILEAAGFGSVVCDQDESLLGSTIFNLYCTRL